MKIIFVITVIALMCYYSSGVSGYKKDYRDDREDGNDYEEYVDPTIQWVPAESALPMAKHLGHRLLEKWYLTEGCTRPAEGYIETCGLPYRCFGWITVDNPDAPFPQCCPRCRSMLT